MLPALDCLRSWLSSARWGLNPRAYQGFRLARGDAVAFYVAKTGIAAVAVVDESDSLPVQPSDWPEPSSPREVLLLTLSSVQWLPAPRQLDLELRRHLDAFKSWNPRHVESSWGGFVRSIREVSERDFHLLTSWPQPV